MKSILSYDSKFMKTLEHVADTMLLNILFLVCCIPVVTIGAAWCALFSGCHALSEDTTPFRSFFRGLRSSFKRATLAWLILLAVLVVLVYTTVTVWQLMQMQYSMALFTFIIAVIALVTVLCVTIMVFLFYSRFECTVRQLLKNGLFMHLGHIIRSTIIGIGCWFPVIAFFTLPYLFGKFAPVWLLLYFGVAGNLSVWLMKTPFARLVEQTEGSKQEAQQVQEEETEEETETEIPV